MGTLLPYRPVDEDEDNPRLRICLSACLYDALRMLAAARLARESEDGRRRLAALALAPFVNALARGSLPSIERLAVAVRPAAHRAADAVPGDGPRPSSPTSSPTSSGRKGKPCA
jgi:hypothetical protein